MEFALNKERSREVSETFDAKNFDYTTFFSMLVLTATGFLAIYSATYAAQMNDRFTLQLYFALGGLGVMLLVSILPVRWYEAIAWPLYALCLALLVYVLFFGKTVYGQRNWIQIGSILQFQPSEVAKLGTILALAKYLNGDRDMTRIGQLFVTCAIAIVPVILILLEPDPGSAVIFLGVLVLILLWAGADLFLLFSIVTPGIVVAASLFGKVPMLVGVLTVGAVMFFLFRKNLIVTAVAFAIVIGAAFSTNVIYDSLQPHQKNRIQVLLNPELDPLKTGYNVIQTRMAIGSGGVTGKGFLKGTQTQLRYVPKQWTDFIFSVPAEEFGFVGSAVLLLVYAFVIFRGLAIASSVRSKFSSVLALGITGIWFLHVFINVGMTAGMLPVIGIPLPFMSYGGSALVTNMLMGGLLMNLYRNRRLLF